MCKVCGFVAPAWNMYAINDETVCSPCHGWFLQMLGITLFPNRFRFMI
jgi:hypothetical protein